MLESKVNLISTEQIFKDGLASCGMINAQVLTLMDESHNHSLRAISNGKGAYVCSALDLVEAFGDHKPSRTESHWADAPINLSSSPEVTFFPYEWRWWRTVGHAKSTWRGNILLSSRAKEARELHNNIGHPGDKALCKALENGNLVPTRVTCVMLLLFYTQNRLSQNVLPESNYPNVIRKRYIYAQHRLIMITMRMQISTSTTEAPI